MEFFKLKLIEKVGKVFASAMQGPKYDRYQFAEKWCASETCKAISEFDETLCSQAKSYILRIFETECDKNLPKCDLDSVFYEADMYWLGYLLTYWQFAYDISGKEILKKYNIRKTLDEYDTLHTLELRAAIKKIQEDNKNESD